LRATHNTSRSGYAFADSSAFADHEEVCLPISSALATGRGELLSWIERNQKMPAVELEGRLPAHKQIHPELANAGYTMPRQKREFGKSGKQRVHVPCNISMMQLTARSEFLGARRALAHFWSPRASVLNTLR